MEFNVNLVSSLSLDFHSIQFISDRFESIKKSMTKINVNSIVNLVNGVLSFSI